MTTSVRGGGFTFNLASVGGTWSWTVQTNNIRGGGQVYEVVDIKSPFGLMSNVNLPLPGEVAEAIAASISDLKGQFDPEVALVSPGTSSYSATVTEGDPTSSLADILFQNVGAFGSFLTVTAVPSVAWLSASPTSVIGLNKNEQAQVALTLRPASLLSSGSPYTGVLNLQDNASSPNVVPITVTVVVRPRPTISLSATDFTFTYSIGTSATNSPQTLTITNGGPVDSILNLTLSKVQNTSPWLMLSPASVGPLASAASAAVSLSLNLSGAPQAPGTYVETLLLNADNATNDPQTVTVTLVVSP